MSVSLRVQHVRSVSPSAYVLRIERGDMKFQPGQYLNLGEAGSTNVREYSIYSGVEDPFLEVLIKEIDGGSVSRLLRRAQPGQVLQCDGPFGFFTLNNELPKRRLLFVASGTGISPFHSFVSSRRQLDYLLLHGVRSVAECYDRTAYDATRYVACVSRREPDSDSESDIDASIAAATFHGRVTDYVRQHPVGEGTRCYVCGNSEMIFEIFDLLKRQGIPSAEISAEVYF